MTEPSAPVIWLRSAPTLKSSAASAAASSRVWTVMVCGVWSVKVKVPPGNSVSAVVSVSAAVARKSAAETLLKRAAMTNQGTVMVTPLRISPRDGVTVTLCDAPSCKSPLAGVLRVNLNSTRSLSKISTSTEPSSAWMPAPPVAAHRAMVRISCASLRSSFTTVRVTVLAAQSAGVKVRVRMAASAG